jgi:cellulose synthase/poly-beta-1,6-N-acetylglucosamine synthase-like glycosyltransferase
MTQGNGGATPLVTVVTLAYNVARYIGEAVDSVLRQSFRDFEYLVVDDGSSDSTVQEWAKVARSAGFARLARSLAGWQLLAWHAMPGGGGRAVRGTADLARTTVKRVVARLHLP